MLFKALLLAIAVCVAAAAPLALNAQVPQCTIEDAERGKKCKPFGDCLVEVGSILQICKTGTCVKEYIDVGQGRMVRSVLWFLIGNVMLTGDMIVSL
jgi:hypothetical protein